MSRTVGVLTDQRIIFDAGNSTTRTAAHGAAQFVGTWTPTRERAVQRCLTIVASNTPTGLGGTFVFEFSEDAATATVSETRTITSFSSLRDFDLKNVGAYYRVKWTPSRALTGGEQVYLYTQLPTQYPGPFVRLADQQVEQQNTALPQHLTFLQGFDQNGLSQNIQALLAADNIDGADYAILTKSIDVGRQPDGDYVNAKADGTVFVNTTPLGAGATFTSSWFDSDGWRGCELVVVTNQISAVDGILVEFSGDVEAPTPTVRSTRKYSFTADDMTNGFIALRFPNELDGFRVKYTNGAVAQGSFFIQCDVRVYPADLARAGVETALGPTSSAIMVRSIASAKSDAGAYGNITRSAQGGLRVSVKEYETQAPLKRLDSITGGATVVGSSPAQVATGAPTNTQTVLLQADPANNKLIYLGTSGAMSAGSAMHALGAGASVTFPVGEAQAIYAMGETAGQTLRWTFGVRAL